MLELILDIGANFVLGATWGLLRGIWRNRNVTGGFYKPEFRVKLAGTSLKGNYKCYCGK
jgi:hypothetical protein